MPKPVHITAPWATFEEMTRHLRIPKARQKELDAMAEEGVRQILKARGEASAKTTVKRKVKPRDVSAAA
jgi:hypothetical protein